MKFTNLHNMLTTFSDTKMHEVIAKIIYDHSSNKLDVRDAALEGISFKSVNNVIDLGCAFGFFTRALAGKLKSETKITGIDQCNKYKVPYLESCNRLSKQGEFIGTGVNIIKGFPPNSVDLIICSYAMYFFPEIIPEISRILKPGGKFVTITHSINHLNELFLLIKESFNDLGIKHPKLLPYELLIRNFSNQNAANQLMLYFKNIQSKDYKSSLIFNKGDELNFNKYLNFKKPFYIPDSLDMDSTVFNELINNICLKLFASTKIELTKDDTIFICTNPI